MPFLYIKALHIVFVVTWFAGLFYVVRLFVYYAEAAQLPQPERDILQKHFLGAQKRLWYGITVPSAVLAGVFGFWMLFNYPIFGWLWVKLGFVLGLYGYHALCGVVLAQQQKGLVRYSGMQLRIWNEVATLFLIAIVFLVVVKDSLSAVWGLLGLIGVMILLFLGIWAYKKVREKKLNKSS
jgi:putative membrane protein